MFLRCGAPINHRDDFRRNTLEFASTQDEYRGQKENLVLLFAAGETLDDTTVHYVRYSVDGDVNVQVDIPDYLQELQQNLELKNLCRKAIRKHLIDLDPHTHLFNRIPKLGLVSLLYEYLLYDCYKPRIPDFRSCDCNK